MEKFEAHVSFFNAAGDDDAIEPWQLLVLVLLWYRASNTFSRTQKYVELIFPHGASFSRRFSSAKIRFPLIRFYIINNILTMS